MRLRFRDPRPCRMSLSLGEWKTVLHLRTDLGGLRLEPFNAHASALWVLGLNALLHLTSERLSASELAMRLPWHELVEMATDTPEQPPSSFFFPDV